MSESLEQKAVLDWWSKAYPKYYPCLFAIPNGAQLAGNASQRARQMNKLKSEGLKTGVSDLFLMVARGGYHGLFLEMKAKGKTKCSVSIPQWEHIHEAQEQGYYADWKAGAGNAIELLDDYMKGNIVKDEQ